MANLGELLKQREALEAQIAALQNGARNDAIGQVKALMAEYGLTAADLTTSSRKERPASTVAAKFREPATGSTWSGRGLQPKWLRAAIEGGATLDSYRI